MPGIGRIEAQDQIDQWVASVVRGLSFIDIGGIGERSCNERVTWAQRHGAARAAMADFEPFSHPLWQHWRTETARAGLSGFEEYERANIDDPALAQLLGQWDVVHSTGILYHVPNPVHSVLNLRRLAKRYLIVNSVIVPDVIENAAGRLAFPQASVALFAALRGKERAVLARHYREVLGLDLEPLAPRKQDGAMMPYMMPGLQPSYYPYWWIFTRHSFETLLSTLGMKVRDTFTWRDHAHFVFLQAT